MTQSIKLKSGKILQVDEIPQGHRIEYLARSSEDRERFYVVHAPHLTEENIGQIKDYYGSFGVYIGHPENMQKAREVRVSRFRGPMGDVIYYILNEKEGNLHFPTGSWRDRPSTDTYDGKTVELERLVEGKDF